MRQFRSEEIKFRNGVNFRSYGDFILKKLQKFPEKQNSMVWYYSSKQKSPTTASFIKHHYQKKIFFIIKKQRVHPDY